MLLKKASVRPTVEPLRAMHKIVEEQDKEIDTILGKHHKFMEFATNSSPVQNAMESMSKLPDPPVEPSVLDKLPIPAFKTMKEYNDNQKKCCTRSRKAKKAKKDSIHLPLFELPHAGTLGNIQVFYKMNSNLICENGEPFFITVNQNMFPNSPSIINLKHPHARYFKALIESLNMDDDEGHLNDPSLDMNHHTDQKSQVNYRDEPLDWGTPSAQDYELSSSSDNSIGGELAATAGISHLLLIPASSQRLSAASLTRSSKGKGKQREWIPFNTDNQDNNPDSHVHQEKI